jgi:hypothetical protein
MFWATRQGTKEREAEEELAREMGLKLRECKPIEGFIRGTSAGNATAPKTAKEPEQK